MERVPADQNDSQKRRKKSQEENHAHDMEEEIELYHIVEEDLRLKSTVGWQNAVKSLNAALTYIDRGESQVFLDYCFPRIVSIMLDQHSSKIGPFEKSCVTQCLSVTIPLVIAQLKAGRFMAVFPVLAMVFNKKRTFYKDMRASGMMGNYWNKVSGSPEVRAQCIASFCEMKGFNFLLETLELLVQSKNEELEGGLESEDLRIVLQALLEFRNSVEDTVVTRLCVIVLSYFTKGSDASLKKESSDAVGAIVAIIRRLVDTGIVASESINVLWLELTQRYVESTSLPLRLFGLEQLNQIVVCARASRAFPPRYLVRNAGTKAVNGVYVLKSDSNTATYVLRREDTGQIFTLFCCTMKSGSKWWFISEADKVQPGSDKDVDYYQHQSQYEEFLPPTTNWVPTGQGETPPPELVADTIADNGQEDTSRLDHMLAHWVSEKKVIEEIFGDRIHREIVSRSALLIRFLAENNRLNHDSLETVWKSCIQKDQTLVDEIQNLLIATVPYLSNELLLHLVQSIHRSLEEKLGKNEAFPELMSFLQRLASKSPQFLISRSLEVTTAILQLLWSIQMHCSIANMRLSRSLRDFFQEGLRSDFGETLRKSFLNECIEGIKRSCFYSANSSQISVNDVNNSASKSLELLKFLIDSYKVDQAGIVETLVGEHELASLLFDELAAFVSRSTDKTSQMYKTAIGHRLDLIHYIHVKSPKLELSIPQIERLWNVLSSSPMERELCLVFFDQANLRNASLQSSAAASSSTTISSAFSDDVREYIFNVLICQQTDFKTIGRMGYKCFHTYFIGLNERRKVRGQLTSPNSGSLALLGLDALWSISFEAPAQVSHLAIRELLVVYENLIEEYERALSAGTSERDVIVNDFLNRVFKKLWSVDQATPESLTLVQQCTNLLSGLATSARKSTFISHGLSGRGAYFSLKIVVQRISAATGSGTGAASSPDSAMRSLNLTVYSNQTLALLRNQLEKIVAHPIAQTKILCSGVAPTGDQKTLAELQITDSSELRVLLFTTLVHRGSFQSDQEMLSTGASGATLHPAEIIARNEEYFDILFRVLDCISGQAVHQLLWDFMKKIPTSVHLLRRVSTIGTNECANGNDGDVVMWSPSSTSSSNHWSSLLQGVSRHKAIYTLQIMDSLLLPSDLSKCDFARAYLQRFVRGGGFREVLAYLLQSEFHSGSFNEGAAVALRILKFCMFDSASSEFDLGGQGDKSNYVGEACAEEGQSSIALSSINLEASDYENLVRKIAELVVSEYERSLENPQHKTSRILVDAVKTAESIVSIASSTADQYMSLPKLQAIVAELLMKNENEHAREQWLTSLQSVCKASQRSTVVVFMRMINSIEGVEFITTSMDQYFRMLRFLVQSSSPVECCRQLAKAMLSKLRVGFSTKFLACNERSMEVLVGFLEVLRDIIGHHVDVQSEIARELVEVVCEECLFTLPSEDRRRCPLCTSLETRRPAFKLLGTAISSDATILHDLYGRLIRLFTRSEGLQSKWGQENNVETRGNGEHVGLKNQGCSCYMNSFLQQLFMHPAMRRGLLSAKVSPRPTPPEPTKAEAERNPQLLVGCRIAIEFLGGRVYEANVVGYDPTSGKHTIRYDEGGEVSYVLAEGRQGHENGRYAILPTELTGPEATLEVLRQVQRTFCYLRDSEMRYFNPKALVDSCKCLNLEFSVYQQNDASEFCDKLLDRLETGLKATPQGTKCLQHALGGKLISQKLPKDCGHRYEREEPFIRLELQIRGKESIEESLSAFVEGEVMDGDNKVECELCGMKKAAVRRTCFGTLPNFLILHLKRFDLDYTTFETVKLNGRCSFPMKLNMKPFTKVGIEESEMSTASKAQPQSPDDNAAMDDDGANDSVENATSGAASPTKNRSSIDNIPTSPKSNSDPEYEYRLQGILVHSGVAQGGHYYSFIYDHDSEKWFKFDDEDVTPFDPANIEAECFGGVQRRTWHGSSNSMEMEVFSNALMLFYEKVVPIEADSSMEVDEEARCEYESEVWKSNEVFLQNSYLFDIEFHEFLREMVQSKYIKEQLPTPPNPTGSPTSMDGVSPPPAASDALVSATSSDEDVHATLARIGVEFVLTVLLHSREKHGVARWITVLAAKFAKHKHICKWFFEALSTTKRAQWLRGLVFECPDSIARQSFVHLVSRALTAYEAHIKIDGHAADLQVLQAFVATLIEFLDATSVMQQTHLEECYMLIRNCAEICPTLRKILKDSDMIARLVNFFLSDRSPQALREAFPSSAVPPLAGRFASPDYQYLLEAIISILGLPRRTSESVLAEGNAQYSHRAVLSQKAQEALTEVFEQFQQQGSLGLEQLKAILRTCSSTNSNTPLIDQKAAAILTKYGNQDNPQAVELDGFLMYYTDAAVTSSKNVLQDLRALGFGEDLKRLPPMLPQSSTVLEGLSALSRGSLLTDVFIESALEEDAETVGDLLLRLSIGDRTTSAILLRSLLHCMNSTETGWKCQPVVDVCSQVAQKILAHECDFQQELIELAMVNPEVGLISTAENREKIRQRYVNNSHVPQFIFRQIVLILDLQVKSVKVKAWLMAHRSMWEWMYEWLRLESLKPALGGRTLVLFREPAKLETLCRLGELLGIPYREEERCYIVEGAGYEDVNGIYRSAAQTHDNCLIYTCQKEDIDYTLFRCCMPSKTRRWYISHSPNKSLLGTMTDEDFYFLQCHIDDELPPETGWKVWAKNEKTQPPAPTVRLYSSTIGNVNGVAINGEEFGEGDAVDCGDGVDGDADADTVEYDDSEDEIRVSNERFQAVHLDNQEDGDRSSGPDDFM